MICPHRHVLTKKMHPPRDVAQPTPNEFPLFGNTTNGMEFRVVRFFRTPIFIPTGRAEHQPPPNYFGIAPRRHDIRPRPENQMEMVRHDREAQQINAEMRRKLFEQVFKTGFAVVVILACYRVRAEQKTASHYAIHHVDNGNFIGRKTSARAIRAIYKPASAVNCPIP